MDNEELLDRMQDKIEIGVSRGIAAAFKAHLDEIHIPLEHKVNELQDRVTFWRGALWVVTGVLTAAVAFLVHR